MNESSAKKLIEHEIGDGFRIKYVETRDTFYIFMCESNLPDAVPGKMAAAVNNNSGKVGYSIMSFDEAIDAAK